MPGYALKVCGLISSPLKPLIGVIPLLLICVGKAGPPVTLLMLPPGASHRRTCSSCQAR
ncbi:hypothetical protein [Pseudomonas sp. p21]|uniref:zinc finger domain-containing protein n=1 Tax=Pseudomonas sp. p21 TaxID=1825979 RepID=UPI0009EDC13D